jgi:hypothetical protein
MRQKMQGGFEMTANKSSGRTSPNEHENEPQGPQSKTSEEPNSKAWERSTKISTYENQPIERALAFLMVDLVCGLEKISKLTWLAHDEFQRLTDDGVAPNNKIDSTELIPITMLLPVLGNELQRLEAKTTAVAKRFRQTLLGAGIIAEALDAWRNVDLKRLLETEAKQPVRGGITDQMLRESTPDEVERMKNVVKKFSDKQKTVYEATVLALQALCTLHRVLESIRNPLGSFDPIDRLAGLLAFDFVVVLTDLRQGGAMWKTLEAAHEK